MDRLRHLVGKHKSFEHRWVGDPWLNAIGLHPARIAITDLCLRMRRAALGAAPAALEGLWRDGVAVIPDVLPPAVFAALRDEAHAAIAAAPPRPRNDERGFGRKRPFDGGFDRFDGDTLNRFFDLARLPAAAAAARHPDLARLCELASGFRHRPERFELYQTMHGDEAANPDPQRAAHRDTFHSTIKLWLFVDEATDAHGPFMYVPGSHRMTWARYRWEYARARSNCGVTGADRDGSFRIDAAELPGLELPPLRAYPAAPNSLVIADVRGFHGRGDAPAGTERLALYANLRLAPFSPVAY